MMALHDSAGLSSEFVIQSGTGSLVAVEWASEVSLWWMLDCFQWVCIQFFFGGYQTVLNLRYILCIVGFC